MFVKITKLLNFELLGVEASTCTMVDQNDIKVKNQGH